MDSDTSIRQAAFAHMRHLMELRDVLTANNLAEGFRFAGERIPLINPQRGIFKPTQMQYLLSIKTVFPWLARDSKPVRFLYHVLGAANMSAL